MLSVTGNIPLVLGHVKYCVSEEFFFGGGGAFSQLNYLY